MKKLFLTIVLSVLLSASQTQTEQKIYETILRTILPHEKPIRLWSDSDSLVSELKALGDVVPIKEIDKADIAIVTKEDVPHDCHCLLFVTSYRLLKKYKDKAIGGFFWQKGRPNIIFLKKNLHVARMKLPKSMQQFVEDEL